MATLLRHIYTHKEIFQQPGHTGYVIIIMLREIYISILLEEMETTTTVINKKKE